MEKYAFLFKTRTYNIQSYVGLSTFSLLATGLEIESFSSLSEWTTSSPVISISRPHGTSTTSFTLGEVEAAGVYRKD